MSPFERLEALFAEREPQVRAFLPEEGRFERLRREFAELEARWPDPENRPPLFGVPVGVKDIFHVDGFETRAGSRLPPEVLRGPEAPSVTALKEAGALILGKTVSTEFAYFAPGPTTNPWNPEHTPGGSSSGSAAAVAAGLCPLALGTQTIGSILRPAAFCGVVGFKPTHGRIPADGVIPLAPSYDHVGFFTRNVHDARLASSVLLDDPFVGPPRKPQLAIPEGPYLSRVSVEGRAHFDSVCERLAAAGYVIKTVPTLENFDEIVERHYRLVAAEAARAQASWFARFEDLYDPRTAELIRKGQKITDAEIKEDRAGSDRLMLETLVRLMDRHEFDLWISPPALGPAPRGLDSTGDPVMNLPWTQAGMPALCLPAGKNADGLPMGLQIAGGLREDEDILVWGAGLESVLQS